MGWHTVYTRLNYWARQGWWSESGRRSVGRGVALPVPVVSPAHDRAAGAQSAGMPVTGADSGEFARWGVGLPVLVVSPALNRAAPAQSAGVITASANGGKVTHPVVTLLVAARSPTRDPPCLAQSAGVVFASADGGEAARWRAVCAVCCCGGGRRFCCCVARSVGVCRRRLFGLLLLNGVLRSGGRRVVVDRGWGAACAGDGDYGDDCSDGKRDTVQDGMAHLRCFRVLGTS